MNTKTLGTINPLIQYWQNMINTLIINLDDYITKTAEVSVKPFAYKGFINRMDNFESVWGLYKKSTGPTPRNSVGPPSSPKLSEGAATDASASKKPATEAAKAPTTPTGSKKPATEAAKAPITTAATTTTTEAATKPDANNTGINWKSTAGGAVLGTIGTYLLSNWLGSNDEQRGLQQLLPLLMAVQQQQGQRANIPMQPQLPIMLPQQQSQDNLLPVLLMMMQNQNNRQVAQQPVSAPFILREAPPVPAQPQIPIYGYGV